MGGQVLIEALEHHVTVAGSRAADRTAMRVSPDEVRQVVTEVRESKANATRRGARC